MRLALLPLDERPANTRYPAQVAAIAGARLVLPPHAALPNMKRRANQARLTEWLRDEASRCAGIVASIDLLGYGGLINSRIGEDSIATVLRAVEPLTTLRTPERPVFAFNVIQRISNADESTEEPSYWADYGKRLYRHSRELDGSLSHPSTVAQEERVGVRENSQSIEIEVPQHILQDWLARRARNHAVNLAMLREATLGNFDLLVLSSDDTSPIGLSARERKHLEFWRDALLSSPGGRGAGGEGEQKIIMYPGADDVGTAMVARMINHKRHHAPRVFVHYADDAMRNNVAPYEDRPIHVTVETQIMAVGAWQAASLDDADVILVVSPPFERISGDDHDPHWLDRDLGVRREVLLPTVRQIACWLDEGRRVAVADVAFPNSAEPIFVELLLEQTEVEKLAAFGGWNTAGNTLGTVLGAACVPCDDDRARQVALAHHLLEDWGYQSVVRDDLHSWLSDAFGGPNIPPAHLDEATAFTAAWLQPIAERIRAAGLPCDVTDVRHPWARTFEVDFNISE